MEQGLLVASFYLPLRGLSECVSVYSFSDGIVCKPHLPLVVFAVLLVFST